MRNMTTQIRKGQSVLLSMDKHGMFHDDINNINYKAVLFLDGHRFFDGDNIYSIEEYPYRLLKRKRNKKKININKLYIMTLNEYIKNDLKFGVLALPIAGDPFHIYEYLTTYKIKKRFRKSEIYILESIKYSVLYATKILNKRWYRFENKINKSEYPNTELNLHCGWICHYMKQFNIKNWKMMDEYFILSNDIYAKQDYFDLKAELKHKL